MPQLQKIVTSILFTYSVACFDDACYFWWLSCDKDLRVASLCYASSLLETVSQTTIEWLQKLNFLPQRTLRSIRANAWLQRSQEAENVRMSWPNMTYRITRKINTYWVKLNSVLSFFIYYTYIYIYVNNITWILTNPGIVFLSVLILLKFLQ